MKALLLAAGIGSRLKPITNDIPKCLVEIDGEPLLGRWIRAAQTSGCDEIIINTHYMSEKVNNYLSKSKYDNVHLNILHEEELQGTAGTLLTAEKWLGE